MRQMQTGKHIGKIVIEAIGDSTVNVNLISMSLALASMLISSRHCRQNHGKPCQITQHRF